MKKILVIDDDPTIREYIKYILITANYKVCDLSSASLVIDLLRTESFDLVLCDIDMLDGLSGFDLLKAIRESGNKIRFAFLSGRGKISDIEQAMLLGADDYVIKPIEIESLVSKVYRLTATTDIYRKLFTEKKLNRWVDNEKSIILSNLSEDGMKLIFKSPKKINDRLKISSAFFEELGIRTPWFRVNSCRQINPSGYAVQVSFIGMSEAETSRVRSWMLQYSETKNYLVLN